MSGARALLAFLALVLAGSSTTPGPRLAGVAEDRDAAAYHRAVELFSASGFDLPPVEVRFHSDESRCWGNRGQVVNGDDGVVSVHVCATNKRSETQVLWRARTLLHELAHVWVNAATADATRDRFVAVRGLERWFDPDDAWGDRGIEHSAEVFLWGLMRGEYDPDFRVERDDCRSLADGFEVLTGRRIDCR